MDEFSDGIEHYQIHCKRVQSNHRKPAFVQRNELLVIHCSECDVGECDNILRFGGGPFGGRTDLCSTLMEALRAEKIGDRKDALMIETALRNGDIFVTEEKRILEPPENYPDEINLEQIISEQEFVSRIHE